MALTDLSGALRRIPDRLRGADGQAIVELAVVLPVILILILGIVDIGKAFGYQNDETHLANEAARYAAVGSCGSGPPACTDIIGTVKADAPPELRDGTGSIAPPGVDITLCYPETHAVGDPIRATVTATYNWLPYLVTKLGLPDSVQITATATSRIETTLDPIPGATDC